MAVPQRLERLLGYGAVGLGLTALLLALLQTLLAQQLVRNRLLQRAGDAAQTARLASLALESLPPAALAQLGGLQLMLKPPPAAAPLPEQPALQQLLCQQLRPCPALRPATVPQRGVWLELASPLEPVWLLVPLPRPAAWPPEPALLLVAVAAAGVSTTLLYLTLEVEQPLRRLQQRLDGLDREPAGEASWPVPQPPRGTGAVRALADHLAAAQQRLRQAGRERTVMLAGLAHDLRAPLTRLRLRLCLQPGQSEDRAAADLDALERLIDQFLAFAASDRSEPAVLVPLQQLLAEVAAAYPPDLMVDLTPLQRWVPPTTWARAVANLLDNALSHGQPPLLLRLLPWGRGDQGFAIEVWDGGAGIAEADWQAALQPFQRLDPARRQGGHSGLGLPIAERAARACGGELVLLPPSPALQARGLNSGVGLRADTSGHNCTAAQLHSSQSQPQG
ncbi:MAG: hypothetical protein RLZZ336_817 [Cyanobacteriota bacterium]